MWYGKCEMRGEKRVVYRGGFDIIGSRGKEFLRITQEYGMTKPKK